MRVQNGLEPSGRFHGLPLTLATVPCEWGCQHGLGKVALDRHEVCLGLCVAASQAGKLHDVGGYGREIVGIESLPDEGVLQFEFGFGKAVRYTLPSLAASGRRDGQGGCPLPRVSRS